LPTQARLGAGAYGEVYKGQNLHRDIAVKRLLRARGAQELLNFYREMELLSELRHENIVRFLGASIEESDMCILFELCRCSLYDMLHKSTEPLPPQPELVRILREVALGMIYLHMRDPPVLHLDLKSANVLLDEHYTAKVCDFGMSHVMEDAAAAAAEEEGRGIGAPQWTAPEKLRGEKYDEKADVYSYGVVLYETMARRMPYLGRNQNEIVIAAITRSLPRLRLADEESCRWDPALLKLMERLLEEEPSKRPTFDSVLDVLAPLAPKETPSQRALSLSIQRPASSASAALPGPVPFAQSPASSSETISSSEIAREAATAPGEAPAASIRSSSPSQSCAAAAAVVAVAGRSLEDRAGPSAEWRHPASTAADHVSPSTRRLAAGRAPLAAACPGEAACGKSPRKLADCQRLGGLGSPEPEASCSDLPPAPTRHSLRVKVLQVEKNKEGKIHFVIECRLDDAPNNRPWTVIRREQDVQNLHQDLCKASFPFLPDDPTSDKQRFLRRDHVQLSKKVNTFLCQVTDNGQWMWRESAMLRKFLQVPTLHFEQLQEMGTSRGNRPGTTLLAANDAASGANRRSSESDALYVHAAEVAGTSRPSTTLRHANSQRISSCQGSERHPMNNLSALFGSTQEESLPPQPSSQVRL